MMTNASQVDIVEVDPLRAVFLLHHIWNNAYWHTWEHMEHNWEIDVGYTLLAIDQNIEGPRRNNRRDGRLTEGTA